jgi:hypothetical protein
MPGFLSASTAETAEAIPAPPLYGETSWHFAEMSFRVRGGF